MPRGAKMSLTLNEPKVVALHLNSNTSSKHAPEVGRSILILYAEQLMENQRGSLIQWECPII
jgi:hypothetical protein